MSTVAPARIAPTRIGPSDDGRPMSLYEFSRAAGAEGRDYELSRGVITVVDIADFAHFRQEDELRDQLKAYDKSHPGVIFAITGSMQSKVESPHYQSERHPDLAVYRTPRPDVKNYWSVWVPEVVVEIVSRSSAHRDYQEKPPEYLAFGVGEYWIFDRFRQQATFNVRSGTQWKATVLQPDEVYLTPLLPSFTLDCRAVFDAAANA